MSQVQYWFEHLHHLFLRIDDQSKHKFRDQVLKTRSNTWFGMKKFYNFFIGLSLFIHGSFSQVTEVYTTVDPRENSGYIVNGGSARVGDRKEIVSIQYPSQGSVQRKRKSWKSLTWSTISRCDTIEPC